MKVKRFDFYFNPNDSDSLPTFDEIETGKYMLYSDHVHSMHEVLQHCMSVQRESDKWRKLAEESMKLANNAINN